MAVEMTKRVVEDIAGVPVANAKRPPGRGRRRSIKTQPRKAVRWSSSGRRSGYVMPTTGRDDQKVETNEIRTLPPPPDGHNVRLDDDQQHGPDPPHCAGRSTPAHLRYPSDRPVPVASCIPRPLL